MWFARSGLSLNFVLVHLQCGQTSNMNILYLIRALREWQYFIPMGTDRHHVFHAVNPSAVRAKQTQADRNETWQATPTCSAPMGEEGARTCEDQTHTRLHLDKAKWQTVVDHGIAIMAQNWAHPGMCQSRGLEHKTQRPKVTSGTSRRKVPKIQSDNER